MVLHYVLLFFLSRHVLTKTFLTPQYQHFKSKTKKINSYVALFLFPKHYESFSYTTLPSPALSHPENLYFPVNSQYFTFSLWSECETVQCSRSTVYFPRVKHNARNGCGSCSFTRVWVQAFCLHCKTVCERVCGGKGKTKTRSISLDSYQQTCVWFWTCYFLLCFLHHKNVKWILEICQLCQLPVPVIGSRCSIYVNKCTNCREVSLENVTTIFIEWITLALNISFYFLPLWIMHLNLNGFKY